MWNPITGATEKFNAVPGGGPGYYRTASLISCWSSAPFLHNKFAWQIHRRYPSVGGRMEAFNDAVEKSCCGRKNGPAPIPSSAQARNATLQIQLAAIPEPLRTLLKPYYDKSVDDKTEDISAS